MEKEGCRIPYDVLKAAGKILDDNGILFFVEVGRDGLLNIFKNGLECEWNKYEVASRESFMNHVLHGNSSKADVVISLSSSFLKSFFRLKDYGEWIHYVKEEKREKEVLHTIINSGISPYSKYPPTILAMIPREFIRGAFVTKMNGARNFVDNPAFYNRIKREKKLDFMDNVIEETDTQSFIRVRELSKEQK